MLCFTSPTRKRLPLECADTFALCERRRVAALQMFTAQRLDDFILRGVDVLVFVHENEAQFFAPAFRRGRWFVRRKIPEQLQGELFQIVKIQDAVVALASGEAHGKFLRQPEQRRHVAANPVPILGQRVIAIFDRGERRRNSASSKISSSGWRKFFALPANCRRRQRFVPKRPPRVGV